jgi:hypothetical protein
LVSGSNCTAPAEQAGVVDSVPGHFHNWFGPVLFAVYTDEDWHESLASRVQATAATHPAVPTSAIVLS